MINKLIVNVEGLNTELKSIIKYKIPYISKSIVNIKEEDDQFEISTNSDNVDDISSKILVLVKETCDDYIELKPKTIFENSPAGEVHKDEIFEKMMGKGMIVNYGNGLVGIGKEFLKLYNYFDGVFLKWAKDYQAIEYIYPDLIDIESLNRYNYISQFPNQILFAAHLQEDLEKITEFSKKIGQDDECLNDEYLEKPKYVNKTSICVHVYKQFENRNIDLNDPIIITSVGRCKRYESLNMTKLERLFDFSMREIVFIGSQEYVLKKREEFISLTKEFVKKLDVKANIKTSNDPFFTSEYSAKSGMQKKFKFKYELNIVLPYSGKELSVGSFNYHDTYFSDAFKIGSTEGKQVYTSCVGFGLERLVYAYLCQKGLNNLNKLEEVLA